MHRYSQPLLIVTFGVVALLTIGAFVSKDAFVAVAPDNAVLLAKALMAKGDEGALLHLLAVGLVTFFIVLAIPRWWLVSTAAITLAIGMAELVQPVFSRGAQWSDFAAGGAGILIGVALAGAVLATVRIFRDH